MIGPGAADLMRTIREALLAAETDLDAMTITRGALALAVEFGTSRLGPAGMQAEIEMALAVYREVSRIN